MRLFQVSVSKGLHGSVVALPSPEQRRLSRQRVNAQRSESVGGQGPARKCGCPTITVTDEVLEQQRLSRQRVNAQRSAKKRAEEGAKRVAEEVEKYDPINDPNISEDPYKTLLIARVNYETTESRIKREFEAYGPIKRVRLVAHKEKNKPRAYAFIEYMHTRDMKGS